MTFDEVKLWVLFDKSWVNFRRQPCIEGWVTSLLDRLYCGNRRGKDLNNVSHSCLQREDHCSSDTLSPDKAGWESVVMTITAREVSVLCPQFPVVRQCSAESGPEWGLGCPGLAALHWCNVMCNALYSDHTPPRTNPWRQLIPRMYVNWWSDAHTW